MYTYIQVLKVIIQIIFLKLFLFYYIYIYINIYYMYVRKLRMHPGGWTNPKSDTTHDSYVFRPKHRQQTLCNYTI